MAKEKFVRRKPVNKDAINQPGNDNTILTATITNIMAKKSDGKAKAYEQIDATPEERQQPIFLFWQPLYVPYLVRHQNVEDNSITPGV